MAWPAETAYVRGADWHGPELFVTASSAFDVHAACPELIAQTRRRPLGPATDRTGVIGFCTPVKSWFVLVQIL